MALVLEDIVALNEMLTLCRRFQGLVEGDTLPGCRLREGLLEEIEVRKVQIGVAYKFNWEYEATEEKIEQMRRDTFKTYGQMPTCLM